MSDLKRRLEGKAAIVTGGATGIGEAIVHRFSREGASVVVCGLPGDPVEDVVRAVRADGGVAVACIGDVASELHARACVQTCIDSFGKLDVLVNNAGVFLATGQIEEYPIEQFDLTVRNNVRSVFLMTKYAVPHLRKTRGNIISAGSESGMIGLPENAPYAGTKGFIHAFMESVAVEQAKHGIRANVVCPGAVDTAWTHRQTSPMTLRMEKTSIMATPMGRRGTVEEIANVYAFLASDEASFVTGALWEVDGGITKSKGAIGIEAVGREVREAPEGELRDVLHHTHEGMKGKKAA